jgi:hypothetical protein
MNTFGDPVERDLYFWIGGGHAHRMAALYGAHVNGRWLNAGWGAQSLGISLHPGWVEALKDGTARHLALLGTPEEVPLMLGQLQELGMACTPIFDEVDLTGSVSTRALVTLCHSAGS